MDISIVSLFLFHTDVAGQIKGGQHQFIKLSFYDLFISHHFTSLNIFPSPPPPSHKVTVDSVMSNSEKRKATKLLKVHDATVSFFPTSDKIMSYLSKGVCSTVAYLGG